MHKRFKPHLEKLVRYQTSVGRDLEKGIRLDRNERVSNFDQKMREDFFKKLPPWIFNASPEPEPFYQKISKFLGIDREKIYVTNGITEASKFLFETLTNPGDNIIVLDPTYPMYSVYAKFYQVEYRKFSYTNQLAPDWASLERSIDDKTAFVVIPNPNLPIESALSLDEIKKIAQLCKKHNSFLLVDEAYHYFGAPSAVELIDQYDHVFVGRSFSKAFGMAGIRLGFLLGTKENINYVAKTRSLVEANALSMAIAGYLIEHPEVMQAHIREVKEGALYLQTELTQMGLRWHGGNVTNGILVFLDDESESKDLVNYLREKKIYIRGAFEPPFQSCVRISIGSKEMMAPLVTAFQTWLKKRTKALK